MNCHNSLLSLFFYLFSLFLPTPFSSLQARLKNNNLPSESIPLESEELVNQMASNWSQQDLELFKNAPNPKFGWHHDKNYKRVQIWHIKDPSGNPNHLYWFKVKVEQTPSYVVQHLLNPQLFLNIHKDITKEYVDGKLLGYIEKHPVLYQYFRPAIPLIHDRDLIHVSIAQKNILGPDGLSGTLISYRSLPYPKQSKRRQIGFHGAHFIALDPTDGKTLIYELDREDQGGHILPEFANLTMPHFLNLQAKGFQKAFSF